MKIDDLIAIDVHTHAEVSCRQAPDPYWQPFEDAANKYFKAPPRPTIAETIKYYREKKIGLVMFTVDSEFQIGNRRIPNDEIAEAAAANSDMMIAFASIDPHKGMMGVREARELIESGAVKGFKFHPTCQGFYPNDKMAYKLYEVIAEYKLPAIFHTGHSGIGTGLPGGGALRLKYSQPIHIAAAAAAFPDVTIIRPPVLALDGRGAVDGAAKGECLHRPLRLDAEILPAADRAVRQRPVAPQDAVRVGLPADPARPLDQAVRGRRLQAGDPRPHPQAERGQGPAPGRLRAAPARSESPRRALAGFFVPAAPFAPECAVRQGDPNCFVHRTIFVAMRQ